MKAWKLKDYHKLEAEISDDTGCKNCVKVKITRVGLCAGDAALYASRTLSAPVVPGRVAAGLISESADLSLKKGQRVLLSPYAERGGAEIVNGKDCDGYLCDFKLVPEECVYPLPEGIDDETVAFAEDAALAINAYETLDVRRTQHVLLYGASTVNLIAAQLCLYYQAIPVVLDTDAEALARAADLGVYYTVNPSEEDALMKIKEITSGNMANHILLDTDVFPPESDLFDYVAKGGKVALTGLDDGDRPMKTDVSAVLTKNLTVCGVNSGRGEIETAINMLATGIVRVDSLIARVAEFAEVPDVFRESENKQSRQKTLVRC